MQSSTLSHVGAGRRGKKRGRERRERERIKEWMRGWAEKDEMFETFFFLGEC